MDLTKHTKESFDFFLNRIPKALEEHGRSGRLHAQIANAYKFLGDVRWREHGERSVELCAQALALEQSNPGVTLDMVYAFLWSGDTVRANTHLDAFIAFQEKQRSMDWAYYEALILRGGQLDKLVRVGNSNASTNEVLNLVISVIEADQKSDRRQRDRYAKELNDRPGSDRPEMGPWYRALSAQMQTAGGLRRSTALPAHQPSRARRDYEQFRDALGEDSMATQRRAAQAGLPTDVEVLRTYALEREQHAAEPKPLPGQALMLAWCQRLVGDLAASRATLEELLSYDDLDANDQATALFYLGDQKLITLIDQHRSDISDYLVAYADIARGVDTEQHLNDLQRWVTTTSPSEISLPLVRDVLKAAQELTT